MHKAYKYAVEKGYVKTKMREDKKLPEIYKGFGWCSWDTFYHRYILGLYEILETVTSRFPNVLFEGCSGGGGRNDPGMLYYMPQNWASDDTDATERLYIQYGGSMVYPASTVGSSSQDIRYFPLDM